MFVHYKHLNNIIGVIRFGIISLDSSESQRAKYDKYLLKILGNEGSVISGCVHFLDLSLCDVTHDIERMAWQGHGATFPRKGREMGWNTAAIWVCICDPNTQPLQHFLNTDKNTFSSFQKNWDLIPSFFTPFYLFTLFLIPSYPTVFILRPPMTSDKQMC